MLQKKLTIFQLIVLVFTILTLLEANYIFVTIGDSLEDTIKNAKDNDEIVLYPGVVLTETINFPGLNKNGSLTIRGTKGEGDRISQIVLTCGTSDCNQTPLFIIGDDLNLNIQDLELRSVNNPIQMSTTPSDTNVTFSGVVFKYGESVNSHYFNIADQMGVYQFINCEFIEIKISNEGYAIFNVENKYLYFENTQITKSNLVSDSYSIIFDIDPVNQELYYIDEEETYDRVTLKESEFETVYLKRGKLKIDNYTTFTGYSIWESGDLQGTDQEDSESSELRLNCDFLIRDHSEIDPYNYTMKNRYIKNLHLILNANHKIDWEGYESITLESYGFIVLEGNSQMNINTDEKFENDEHFVASIYGVDSCGIILEAESILSIFNHKSDLLPRDNSSVWGFLMSCPIEIGSYDELHDDDTQKSELAKFYFHHGYFTMSGGISTNGKIPNWYVSWIINYGVFIMGDDTRQIYLREGDSDQEIDKKAKFNNYGYFESKTDSLAFEQEYVVDVPFYNYNTKAEVTIAQSTNATFTASFVQTYIEHSTQADHDYQKHPFLFIKKGAAFNAQSEGQEFIQGTIRGSGSILNSLTLKGTILWPGYDRNSQLVYEFPTLTIHGSLNLTEGSKLRAYIYDQNSYEKLKITNNANDDSQFLHIHSDLDIVFLWPYVANLSDSLTVVDLSEIEAEIDSQDIDLEIGITNVSPGADDREDPSTLELSQRFWKTIVEPGTPGESDYDPYSIDSDETNTDYYQKEMEVVDSTKVEYQDYFQEFECICGTDMNSLFGLQIRAKGCPPGKEFQGSRSQCLDCSRGTFSEEYASTACTVCQPGTYSSDQGSHTCIECGKGTFSELGAGECSECSVSKYNDEIAQSTCKDCPDYTRASTKGATAQSDCKCKPKYYGTTNNCQECPPGGVCTNLDTIVPLADEGFWNRSATEAYFYGCIPRESCTGEGKCSENYQGRMCGECVEDTYRLGNFCVKCGNEKTRWRGFAWFALLILSCWGIYQFSIIGYPPAVYFATVTILIYFIQEISLLSLFELYWPKALLGLFDVFSIFTFNIDLLAAECYNPNFTIVNKFIFGIFVPIIFGLVYYLYYVSASVWSFLMEPRIEKIKVKHREWFDQEQEYHGKSGFIKKHSHRALRKLFHFRNMDEIYILSNNCYNSFGYTLSFIYATVSYWMMKPMDCTKYSTGFTVFDPEPTYSCDGSRYSTLLAFSIIFFLIYSCGIPLWMFYQFKKNKDTISFREEYGLLIGRFKDEWYYWELVLMMRRLLFVIFSLFLSRYPMMQTAFAEMSLFLMLLLQLYARPYKEDRHNRLEFTLLSARVVVSLCGTLFYGGDLSSDHIINLLIAAVYLLVICSVIALAVMLRYDYKDNLHLMEEKNAERRELEKQLLSSGALLPSSIKNEKTIAGQKVWKTMEIMHFLRDDTVPSSLFGWLLQAEKEQRERFADIACSVIDFALEQTSKVGVVPLKSNIILSGSEKSKKDSVSTSSESEDELKKKDQNSDDDELKKLEQNSEDHLNNCRGCWEDEILPFVADAILYWLDEASVLEKRSLSVIFRSLDMYMKEHSENAGSLMNRRLRKIKRKMKKVLNKFKKSGDNEESDETQSTSTESSGEGTSSSTGSTTPTTSYSSTTPSSDNDKSGDLELKELDQNHKTDSENEIELNELDVDEK
ncbi:repeat outer membrane protein [Anaeramoeba flamelloides]|uniref:Repeat outer membrane protein n=1 Tax=Anaeramoeba flamelloides TaxID=1746091 RepID=A0AAV7ZRV1_9EUKA|nr:repeat outer membrane protein [Anaeramoeba flamelloides]